MDNDRIYLSIADGYRDKQRGHSRTITIKSLGYLDELEKVYSDPVAHFKTEVKKMNEQKTINKLPYTFSISPNKCIPAGSANRKNFGYAALSKIYHEPDIHTFIRSRQRNNKSDYDVITL